MAEDLMSPAASPGQIAKKSGVRRVNNLPVYLVGAAIALFLGIMVMVAMDRAAQHGRQEKKKTGGTTEMFAHQIAGNNTGIVPAETPPAPPVPALVPPEEKPAPALVVPIAHPDLDHPPAPPRDEEAIRIHQAKVQAFEEAVKAKTHVAGAEAKSRNGGSTQRLEGLSTHEENLARLAETRRELAALRENPTAGYQAGLQQIRERGRASRDADPDAAPAPASAREDDPFARFDGQGDRWRSGARTEAPATPYLLRAGSVMPGTMLSGVNSELAGQILAQVSADVFDTASGRHVLVPQGARLVGTYDNRVAYGQSRVLIAWQRIVFPDGKVLDLGAMPGADGAGYAGFEDQVNHHFLRTFGSALLMSLITGGISYTQSQFQNQNPGAFGGYQQSATGSLSAALGQQLGAATAAMLRKNLNIAPTIEIRPGYRFNVMVSKDLTFGAPYRSFDYASYRPVR